MIKKLAIPVVILILVVIGAYLYLNKPQPITTPSQVNTTETEKRTLMDLFKSGSNQICEINDTDNRGTVKVTGNKSRIDMTTTTNGQTIATHIIVDTDYSYMWNDNSGEGFKFKNPDPTTTSSSSSTPTTESSRFDLNQKVDLRCSPWTVDDSVFALPTNIKFNDLESMMQNPSMNSIHISTCDQISDPTAKAACISALNK